MKVYCLYNALSGDSRGLIYTSKVALYIDKENVGDRTIIIITMPIHYAMPVHHHFMLCMSEMLHAL